MAYWGDEHMQNGPRAPVHGTCVLVKVQHLGAVRDGKSRRFSSVAVMVIAVAVAVLMLDPREESFLEPGGESVLIEAVADGESRYCSGTAVLTDEVVTAAHCVRDARVSLLSWRGATWTPGRISILDGDVARIEVSGIGAAGGVAEAELRGEVLVIEGWQGRTRSERAVHRCETSRWSVERSKVRFVCGFSNGASGAGVIVDGALVAVVTSKHPGGVNSASLLAG